MYKYKKNYIQFCIPLLIINNIPSKYVAVASYRYILNY